METYIFNTIHELDFIESICCIDHPIFQFTEKLQKEFCFVILDRYLQRHGFSCYCYFELYHKKSRCMIPDTSKHNLKPS